MDYTRSVIITGGTINLGYHTALQIARQHPNWLIVISSRSDREHAAESINKTLGQNNVVFIPLDLSESKSVRAYAKEWASKNYPLIQAVLLNAALQFPDRLVRNSEGIEATFAICHLGHALLFHLLCPHLAANARVIVTSSGTHDPAMKSGLPDAIYTSAEELARPPPVIANGPGRRHYANSKLANIMWTYTLHKHLSQRIPDRGITVNAFDPGLMPGSGLAREYSPFFRFAWNKIMPRTMPLLRVVFTPNIHKLGESAALLVQLAIADNMAGVSGKYFEGLKAIRSSKDSYDE
ncbi:hypothetical protein DL764_009641 [Monosporascus ibericus]|uniref:Ketoreductase (KR) domain-containing protein n=1 Tax=Monosporascus ibericus TaxID=155417 RepID=A0A4Q4SWR7_9PEZI|nr:hypothetical protein DL764_009641 [Monosporascus ibericus]